MYIDTLNTAARTVKALKRGQFAEASMLPFSRINKTWNPLWNFRRIMDLEEKYGAKSTFYFLTLDPGNEDFTFSIEELEGELGYILEEGWEVGLHGGHEAYNNLIEIKKEKTKAGKSPRRKSNGIQKPLSQVQNSGNLGTAGRCRLQL
ncbi:polysaccharide deacetylase family protein [Methanosarcina horonobensis]|uniref:hypothetical protein n=1 Tax=Methanosarcina horonobensis TaxID=418008 RepID=UPI000A5CCA4F